MYFPTAFLQIKEIFYKAMVSFSFLFPHVFPQVSTDVIFSVFILIWEITFYSLFKSDYVREICALLCL